MDLFLVLTKLKVSCWLITGMSHLGWRVSHYWATAVVLFSLKLNCSLQSALQKSGCKDQHNGCGQLGWQVTAAHPGKPGEGPRRRRMASVAQAQAGFLNGLHGNEGVVTAVALDWPRISQFSVELYFQFQVKDIFCSLLGNVWFPYYLVNQISELAPANDT